MFEKCATRCGDSLAIIMAEPASCTTYAQLDRRCSGGRCFLLQGREGLCRFARFPPNTRVVVVAAYFLSFSCHTHTVYHGVWKVLHSSLNIPLLTIVEPQSSFGDKTHKFQAVCPQNGTAVLKGSTPLILHCKYTYI